MWKAYIKGNYFFLVKGNELVRRLNSLVEIRKTTVSGTEYEFNDRYDTFKTLDFSEIVKQDDTPYTPEEWETFIDEQTGVNGVSVPETVVYIGAKLMKTGQSTSYRTGDDGDLQEGRAVNFFTLPNPNPFGNTIRFTDELGGQTYTNDIVIDWSTFDGFNVLGYQKTPSTIAIWSDAVANSLLVSLGIYTSGWRLPNSKELYNITNVDTIRSLSYPPFNDNSNNRYWTGTTYQYVSTHALYLLNQSGGSINILTKTQSLHYIPVRTFTVNGTTLT